MYLLVAESAAHRPNSDLLLIQILLPRFAGDCYKYVNHDVASGIVAKDGTLNVTFQASAVE